MLLKDKSRSVTNSIGILKARKQALIKEFLAATLPFLRSREDIRKSYGKALRELALTLGREGRDTVASITKATRREFVGQGGKRRTVQETLDAGLALMKKFSLEVV